MTDEQAACVPEIRLEHLGLASMTMILGPAFERRVQTLAPESQGAMQRNAFLPVCEATAGIRLAA